MLTSRLPVYRELWRHPRPPTLAKRFQPWRPRKDRAVSIAAGFNFDGGLLFCADTKIITGIKTNGSKLFQRVYGANHECGTVFAVAASDFELAKAGVRDCEDAIEKMNLAVSSLESVRNAIQSALGNSTNFISFRIQNTRVLSLTS